MELMNRDRRQIHGAAAKHLCEVGKPGATHASASNARASSRAPSKVLTREITQAAPLMARVTHSWTSGSSLFAGAVAVGTLQALYGFCMRPAAKHEPTSDKQVVILDG